MDKELYEKLAIGTRYYQIGEQMVERVEEEEQNLKAIKREFNSIRDGKIGFSDTLLPVCKAISILSAIFFGLAVFVTVFDLAVVKDGEAALFVILPIISIVSFIGMRISKQKLAKAEKESAQIYETIYKLKIEAQEAKIAEVTEATKQFAQENYHLVEFMPPEFRDFQAMSYMLLAVSNGRADTLKEAINLYETQLHRWHLESLAERSVEAQEYLNRAMDELNARQAETNAHLAAIEYMKYVEYFKNSSKQ